MPFARRFSLLRSAGRMQAHHPCWASHALLYRIGLIFPPGTQTEPVRAKTRPTITPNAPYRSFSNKLFSRPGPGPPCLGQSNARCVVGEAIRGALGESAPAWPLPPADDSHWPVIGPPRRMVEPRSLHTHRSLPSRVFARLPRLSDAAFRPLSPAATVHACVPYTTTTAFFACPPRSSVAFRPNA